MRSDTISAMGSEEFEFEPPFKIALYAPSLAVRDLLYTETPFLMDRSKLRELSNGVNAIKYVLCSPEDGPVTFLFYVNDAIRPDMIDTLSGCQPNVMLMISNDGNQIEEMTRNRLDCPARYVYLHNENKTPDFGESPECVEIKQGISTYSETALKGFLKLFIDLEKTLRVRSFAATAASSGLFSRADQRTSTPYPQSNHNLSGHP